ncbi:ABC transporter ATP-binding protein/permease [Clostridium sp. MSJ-8]|uniref:ABC transporter ATP-binding protein n=1 Tax=Clostridium sp. MSJ-8 TaxID=2841510 RepID=UPI001C0ED8AD|nr:ABC transporter ATP-binding protein [Clostridium sp. MSJ-8]MBU5487839.1 ABC transporter ATP-binding protein/permease [Clostridium sp. MSJ-8]
MKDKTIKKLMSRLKKYKALIIFSLIFALVTVILTLYLPIIIGEAIDCIVSKGNVDYDKIITLLIRIGIVIAITAVVQWAMNICNNKITFNITRDIRNEAINKIETVPLKFIDAHSHGDIASRVIADVDQLADGLLMGFTQFFTGIITILGTLIFMFSINVWIALLVVCLTPLSLLIAKYIASHTYSMFKVQSEIRGEETSYINEILGGEKVVKSFGYEDKAIETFDEVNDRLKHASLKALFYSSITNPATRFVNSLVYAGVILIGSFSVISGGLSIGLLTCFLSYATQYTKPFNEISGVITELQNAFACAARIFELIEEPSEVEDSDDAISITDVQGNVELKNVSFSYVSDKKLIENFNINVKPGERVAIVGPTGCGKTTVINLLMRFYDVNSGDIYVDGNKIKNITRKSLRKSYGMVLQDTWLKSGTIRENIIMGKMDATEEEIINACKEAHSYEFIRRMPKGLDTYITEDGGGLSQGQKQLLCITRVMLTLPPMLILDEATSSIDTRTEMKIQNAFAKIMKGRTSFIVAHRLSTIQSADIILVMKDGKIIEQGNHEELIKQNGFYANLYNSQFENIS